MGIDKEDNRLYLQFLQNNIARMNTNSAQAKTWCITIVAALLAIFADTKNSLFLFICITPIIMFCMAPLTITAHYIMTIAAGYRLPQ